MRIYDENMRFDMQINISYKRGEKTGSTKNSRGTRPKTTIP